jgi:hypothetical protein
LAVSGLVPGVWPKISPLNEKSENEALFWRLGKNQPAERKIRKRRLVPDVWAKICPLNEKSENEASFPASGQKSAC